MNPRIEKLKAERDKLIEKDTAYQARIKVLDEQIMKIGDEAIFKLGIGKMNRDMVRNIIHGHSDKGKFEFDGIFCSSDHLALIVKEELENIGIRVPQDVQIIGFDGIQIMNGGKPIVSSIQQPVAQIAQTGVRILLQLIEEGSAESVVDLPVRFVEGGTTRQ